MGSFARRRHVEQELAAAAVPARANPPRPAPMPAADADVVAPGALQSGDVLLSRGCSQVSHLMAWNAECPYSHAAIVANREVVIEAVATGVRCRRLPMFATDAAPLDFTTRPDAGRPQYAVDVYRAVGDDGRELGRAAGRRIGLCARQWLGAPFAHERMLTLALSTLLRHKVGLAGPRRRIRAWRLTCVELVYLALHESVGFPLQPRSRRPTPLPPLDVRGLVAELRSYRSGRSIGERLPTPADVPAGLITTDLCSSRRLRRLGRLEL